jgi:hypothetical protein
MARTVNNTPKRMLRMILKTIVMTMEETCCGGGDRRAKGKLYS